MMGKGISGHLLVGVGYLLAIGLGGALAAVHHTLEKSADERIERAENAIRQDISLLRTAPPTAAKAEGPAYRQIIRETGIQLALARMQEVVRTTVRDHGGDVASLSGTDPVAQPWGATLRLTARFEAPHDAITDIFSALETGVPYVQAEEVTLNSRTLPSGDDMEDVLVSADVVFAAFTSARPAAR